MEHNWKLLFSLGLTLLVIPKVSTVDNKISVTSDKSSNRKVINRMLLDLLWDVVYKGYDTESKMKAIEQLRKSGDYGKLVDQLSIVKRSRLEYVLHLIGQLMIAMMEGVAEKEKIRNNN
ncbi:hypothetical protein JYU34_000393 [Plutella xylostella]|uniref:Uncharacterized protein n=1 Tax=Plutella xylostella TaxID=51655 RepID=A0ABQ7R7L2_PLUXY|nr:hypothetical protein JYU34_000393 [Plutella xylostella]